MREKTRNRKKLQSRILFTQWSGFVVSKLKIVVVSTIRDKFNLGLTTNFSANLQITKMKTKVNRPKMQKKPII